MDLKKLGNVSLVAKVAFLFSFVFWNYCREKNISRMAFKLKNNCLEEMYTNTNSEKIELKESLNDVKINYVILLTFCQKISMLIEFLFLMAIKSVRITKYTFYSLITTRSIYFF